MQSHANASAIEKYMMGQLMKTRVVATAMRFHEPTTSSSSCRISKSCKGQQVSTEGGGTKVLAESLSS